MVEKNNGKIKKEKFRRRNEIKKKIRQKNGVARREKKRRI